MVCLNVDTTPGPGPAGRHGLYPRASPLVPRAPAAVGEPDAVRQQHPRVPLHPLWRVGVPLPHGLGQGAPHVDLWGGGALQGRQRGGVQAIGGRASSTLCMPWPIWLVGGHLGASAPPGVPRPRPLTSVNFSQQSCSGGAQKDGQR